MIYVYGAGNGGKMWAEIAREAGITVSGFVDDFKDGALRSDAIGPWDSIIPAIYDNKIRLALGDKYVCIPVVHPKAFVYTSASIGAGTMMKPFAMVGARTKIGRNCILDSGVLVEHDTEIGDGVYISVGSRLGSSVKVGARTLIGINCTIQSDVHIGEDCVINSGSVVFKDVPDGATIKPRL